MDKQLAEWSRIFLNCEDKKPKYDDWLEKFKHLLDNSKDIPIIDLGCGFGNDTLYLNERGYRVISCDYCQEALNRLKHFISEPDIKCFNMLDGLPFKEGSAKIVISDLSLHYFWWKDTKNIVNEIYRVLVSDGYLICRVNSIRDINYGAGQGIKLEHNYYDINGKLKRFFERTDIEKLFDGWQFEYLEECRMDRYDELKIVWEFAAKNIK